MCPQCGQRLVALDPTAAVSQEPPAVALTPPTAKPGLVGEDALRAYLGPNADYYIRQWGRSRQRPFGLSWNWAAFFGGLLWMVYRKMYAYAVIYFVAAMAVGALIEGLHLSMTLKTACELGVVVFVGLKANGWYWLHAQRRVDEIVEATGDADRPSALLRSGGTNRTAAVLIGALWTLLLAVVLRIQGGVGGP
jgi:hypothetical protein